MSSSFSLAVADSMAPLLEFPGRALFWLSEVALSFAVSTCILSFFACIWVFFCRFLDENLQLQGRKRCFIFSLPIIIIGIAVLYTIYDLVSNTEEIATMSDVLPVSSGDEMSLVTVKMKMNKLIFFLCIFFSIPLSLVAVILLSNADRPLVMVGAAIVERYEKWVHSEEIEHTIKRMYQAEWAEKQHLVETATSIIDYCERQNLYLRQEVARLQYLVHSREHDPYLQQEVAELHNQVQAERRNSKGLRQEVSRLRSRVQAERKCSIDLTKKLVKQFSKPKQQQGDDALCVVCMERKRQYLLKPCNHYCVCNACKSTLQNKCPLCRKVIQKYEKIYIA